MEILEWLAVFGSRSLETELMNFSAAPVWKRLARVSSFSYEDRASLGRAGNFVKGTFADFKILDLAGTYFSFIFLFSSEGLWKPSYFPASSGRNLQRWARRRGEAQRQSRSPDSNLIWITSRSPGAGLSSASPHSLTESFIEHLLRSVGTGRTYIQ